MKGKTALIAGALSLSFLGLAGYGPAAQATAAPVAAPGDEVSYEVVGGVAVRSAACANNRLCLFEHDDFRGRTYIQIRMPAPGRCGTLPNRYNNWASSHKNTYNRKIRFYDRRSCAGASGYAARAESQDKDLTNNGFDNKTTSLKR
ncbi:peptidase inhibitor family I36 protein [Nonomuraea sp. NPDC050547]|uniref:peptidase inhibitor family I36 protein n=1 Tax=unclassified Nonomuraea TaxID=2593643 RepID=UPI00379A66AA